MKQPSYPVKLREHAEADGLVLVTFDFERRFTKQGRATFQFAIAKDDADDLEKRVTDLFLEFCKKRKTT